MIEVKNLHKTYSKNEILKGVDFKIKKGDVIAILGPSGSGKTTLLRCLNFLEKSDEGTLIFDNEEFDLKKISKKDISRIRLKTAFVFQNYNLFLNKTAIQNVTEALVTVRKMNKKEAQKIAEDKLSVVGMLEHKDKYPSQLSGGQQQRVSIARALAYNPEVIYFDEPTSALDPELINEVLAVMKDLAKTGITMVVVTHEMTFAKNVSNKIIFMEDGKIIENTDSKSFFENPKSERIKQFIQNVSERI